VFLPGGYGLGHDNVYRVIPPLKIIKRFCRRRYGVSSQNVKSYPGGYGYNADNGCLAQGEEQLERFAKNMV
jgi:hypothetical protein